MTASPPARLLWLYALTIFLGAFLLFQVQPVMAKIILPWFGGSPSVWTTCLLFFQVFLVAGYAYADRLVRCPATGGQVGIHVGLLAVAVLLLPIAPTAAWRPADSTQPVWDILLLLVAHVGLPYFLLATTGPLVQAWFSRVFEQRSPYRLYALSNVGSMLALLSYPLVVEPVWTTDMQSTGWSVSFGLFALLCSGLALSVWRYAPPVARQPRTSKVKESPLRLGQSAGWILLPMLASTALLAVTNFLCQDIAVVPFLWIAPLSLYLLSFIICFDRQRWYQRRWFGVLAAGAILLVAMIMLADEMGDAMENVWGVSFGFADFAKQMTTQIIVYLAALFLLCMVCHGELVRQKPHPRRLTSFYLCISIGGALGGLFVAIVCPLIFNGFYELALVWIVGYCLVVGVLVRDTLADFPRWPLGYRTAAVIAAPAVLFIVASAQTKHVDYHTLAQGRNFYGVLKVETHYEGDEEHPEWYGRGMYHGRTLHGYQFLLDEKRNEPTTYYQPHTGVGLSLRHFPRRADSGLRVGAVGLGPGTVAAYGEGGDIYRFYEINPLVIDFAHRYFTFLSDSAAEIEIVLGDARLSLEREPPQRYDVLILDAFSGDAVPTHLLTREAFAVYWRHMQPEGVICVHISNRYLDLAPVVARHAEELNLPLYQVEDHAYAGLPHAPSRWLLITNNQPLMTTLEGKPNTRRMAWPGDSAPLWTDRYSDLLRVLQ